MTKPEGMDVLSASIWDDKVAWYENDGNQNFTTHAITQSFAGAVPVVVADIDVDGDLDVLAGATNGDTIAWFENDGHGEFETHVIGREQAAYDIRALDFDGDQDLDLAGSEVELIPPRTGT